MGQRHWVFDGVPRYVSGYGKELAWISARFTNRKADAYTCIIRGVPQGPKFDTLREAQQYIEFIIALET